MALDVGGWIDLFSRTRSELIEQRREVVRWAGAGTTAAAALSAVILDRWQVLAFSVDAPLGTFLLLLATYVVTAAIWQILKLQATSVTWSLASRPRLRPKAWEVFEAVYAQPRLTGWRALRRRIDGSTVLTIAVWAVWWISPTPGIKDTLFVLAFYRSALWIVSLVFLLKSDGGKKGLVFYILAQELPDSARARKLKGALGEVMEHGEEIVAATLFTGYFVQAMILFPLWNHLLVFDMDVTRIVLFVALAMILVLWVTDICWPLARHYSGIIMDLRHVEGLVARDHLSTPKEVMHYLEREQANQSVLSAITGERGATIPRFSSPQISFATGEWSDDSLKIVVTGRSKVVEVPREELSFVVLGSRGQTLYRGLPTGASEDRLIEVSVTSGGVESGPVLARDDIIWIRAGRGRTQLLDQGSLHVYTADGLVADLKPLPGLPQMDVKAVQGPMD